MSNIASPGNDKCENKVFKTAMLIQLFFKMQTGNELNRFELKQLLIEIAVIEMAMFFIT